MTETNAPGASTPVDEYIAAASDAARPVLERLLAILRAAAPGATESLKWRQPALSRQRIVYCFAAFGDHINFIPTPESLDPFRAEAEAAGLGVTGIMVQIPLDGPFPEDLIRRIAAHRAAAEAAGARFSS